MRLLLFSLARKIKKNLRGRRPFSPHSKSDDLKPPSFCCSGDARKLPIIRSMECSSSSARDEDVRLRIKIIFSANQTH